MCGIVYTERTERHPKSREKRRKKMKITLKNRRTNRTVEFENKEELYDFVRSIRIRDEFSLTKRNTIDELINELPYAEYDRVK